MTSGERIFRTQAIILRRHDLGEADRILTLYTRDRGKHRVIAKGVRKPKSRKAGHVELFTLVDILVAQGRTLDVLSQVDTLEDYGPLRDDLNRASYASHFGELIDAFGDEGDENRALFEVLEKGLGWLCFTTDLRRTARVFELRVLDAAGYRPELFHCVACGNEIKAENQYYSTIDGGVVCPDSAKELPRARSISLNALKVLRYLQTRPIEGIEELGLSEGVQREVERILHETLSYHLERRLKSAAFLKRLRREGAAKERSSAEARSKAESNSE